MLRSTFIGAASAQFFSTILTEGDQEFIRFVGKYGKNYASRAEFDMRNQIFQDKLAAVFTHNSRNDATYTLGINEFTDLTDEEWAQKRGYLPTAENSETASFDGPTNGYKNWYEDGMVMDPKDQGQCGSCWAFSAVGAIESANAIAGKKLQAYSEQQLVDCDSQDGGCNGGIMENAFQYVKGWTSPNPLMLASDYKYAAKSSGSCAYDPNKGVGTVSSYVKVTPNSPKDLMGALDKGPVSVAIEADKLAFQMYTSGIITGDACGTNLDHGVLAVGYGSESGQDYYVVKNSWGSSWGDKGFVKIGAEAYGKGVCGIQQDASQPFA